MKRPGTLRKVVAWEHIHTTHESQVKVFKPTLECGHIGPLRYEHEPMPSAVLCLKNPCGAGVAGGPSGEAP